MPQPADVWKNKKLLLQKIYFERSVPDRASYHLGYINSFHNTLKRFMRGFNGVSAKHLPSYLNWHIWLAKTAEMIRNTRVDDMLVQAIQHPFVITDKQIHQKVALSIAA